MDTINDLMYEIQLIYEDEEGLKVVTDIKMKDDGLETKSFKVGDVCIIEETINGRILSGRYEDHEIYCGYRYDYDKDTNEDFLKEMNPDIPIYKAVNLINSMKMNSKILGARLVLSSVMRGDNRIIALKSRDISIVKTITAKNEKSQEYKYEEIICMSRKDNLNRYTEDKMDRVYKVDDNYVIEKITYNEDVSKDVIYNFNNINKEKYRQADMCDNIKKELESLIKIVKQRPTDYKKLINFKELVLCDELLPGLL